MSSQWSVDRLIKLSLYVKYIIHKKFMFIQPALFKQGIYQTIYSSMKIFLHWSVSFYSNQYHFTLANIIFRTPLEIASVIYIYVIYIWYKIKLTRTPCFVVEIFLVPGVLAATFEAPIIMKIHISKIEHWPVIFLSKNKSQNEFLTPCTMREHGG